MLLVGMKCCVIVIVVICGCWWCGQSTGVQGMMIMVQS